MSPVEERKRLVLVLYLVVAAAVFAIDFSFSIYVGCIFFQVEHILTKKHSLSLSLQKQQH